MTQETDFSSKAEPEQGTDSNIANDTDEKTVLVLGKENLLGSVVELLLDTVKSWKVIRLTEADSKEISVGDIKKLHPKIVILCQNEQPIKIELLMQLLDECSGLRVITVGLENNSIQVYNKQRAWIKYPSDFLSIVDGSNSSQESQPLEKDYRILIEEQ